MRNAVIEINSATPVADFDIHSGMIVRIHSNAIPPDMTVGDVMFFNRAEYQLIAPPLDERKELWLAIVLKDPDGDSRPRFARRSVRWTV